MGNESSIGLTEGSAMVTPSVAVLILVVKDAVDRESLKVEMRCFDEKRDHVFVGDGPKI